MKERNFDDEEAQRVAAAVHVPLLVQSTANPKMIFGRCATHKHISREFVVENGWMLLPLLKEEGSLLVSCRAIEKTLGLVFKNMDAACIELLAFDVKALMGAARRIKRTFRYEARRQQKTWEEFMNKQDPRLSAVLDSITELGGDEDHPTLEETEKNELLFDVSAMEARVLEKRKMLADRLSGQTVEILSDEDEMPAQKRSRDLKETSSASGAAWHRFHAIHDHASLML